MSDFEWADVKIASFDERVRLNNKALFFIPTAYPKLLDAGITSAALSSFAANSPQLRENETPIGGAAVRKIMNCEPSTYVSARKFILAANLILENRGKDFRFKYQDIVACVFKLKEFALILNSLGLKSKDLAHACEIKETIVESARNSSYRVSLVHALAIRKKLQELAQANSQQPDLLSGLLSENIEGFITASSRNGDTIGVAKASPKGPYFYTRDDLTPAPSTGHPWKIS